MQSFWVDISVIVIFILVSAFFAAAEIAVISLRRTRIQELIEQENRRALAIKELLDDPDKFFAIVQIGMTVFPAAASALSGVIAAEYFHCLLGCPRVRARIPRSAESMLRHRRHSCDGRKFVTI